MKSNNIAAIILCCGVLVFAYGCGNESVVPKVDEDVRTNKLIEAYLDNCTPEERAQVIEKRKANLKMGKYIDIVGREYHVTISKSQAMALGVSDSIYDAIVEELEEFNRFIAENDAKGDTLEMPDVAKEAAEYERDGYNL